MNTPDYSVITATFNEADNIVALLRSIESHLGKHACSYEVIVVDDDSPDGTGALVNEYALSSPFVRHLCRQNERGIGPAYLHGLKSARGRVVCTMDADFSHPPDRLPELLAAADDDVLVLGSRFLRSGDFTTLWYRDFPTRLANVWHSFLLKSGVKDHTNGYLAVRQDILRHLLVTGESTGTRPFDRTLYGLALVALAQKESIKVMELPASYVFRTRGQTKIGISEGVYLFFSEMIDTLRLKARLGAKRQEELS